MDFVYVGSGVVVVLCIFYAVCRWMWSAMIEGEICYDEHEDMSQHEFIDRSRLTERRAHIPLEESMVELNKAREEAERARKESLND